MLKVIILRDNKEIESRGLEPGEYTAGRAPDCDLVLSDGQVSENHADRL